MEGGEANSLHWNSLEAVLLYQRIQHKKDVILGGVYGRVLQQGHNGKCEIRGRK